jgi:hypothetical protein
VIFGRVDTLKQVVGVQRIELGPELKQLNLKLPLTLTATPWRYMMVASVATLQVQVGISENP